MPDDSRSGAFDESPNPAFPEVTRSLRALGSGRSRRAAEEARFFAPLLAARRSAAEARSRAEAVTAFDARRLRAAMDALLRAFASERQPERAAARRALEAELEDLAAPLHRSLAALAEATPASRPGGHAGATLADDVWQRWLDAVRGVFEGADAAWRDLDHCLDSVPVAATTRKGNGSGGGAASARPSDGTEGR